MVSRPVIVVALGVLSASWAGCARQTEPAAGKSASTTVTFSHDVAPILFAHCARCHHPGEAAPFSLLSYEDARRRANQIAEVTGRRFMPPWPPKAGCGEFADARRLTDEQIVTLKKWAASGSPRGTDADLPQPPTFAGGWQLGSPDLILESQPYSLRADGGDVFRNFVVPVKLDAPRWIKAIELRAVTPRATHHARLGVDSSFESVRRDAADPAPGYEGMAWGQDPDGQLVIWVPGMVPSPGTPGTAWRLYPNTSLILHSHLQPTGKAETVQFRIGIHFADQPPTERPVMLRVGSRDVDIPAGEPHHVIADEYTLPVAVDVHSIFPHAHSLCTEVKVDAELPDGSREPLLWIENFDENWHDNYRYVKPVRLPRGTKLHTMFAYDNSAANVRNRRHPPERTVYGSNVVDEMQDVYLRVTPVEADQRAALIEDFDDHERRSKIVGFQKSLEMYPNDPWSREGLAASYVALGKPADAIRVLEERMKLGKLETHSIVMLAMARFAAGDYPQAEKLARQGLDMDAEYPLAWHVLGKSLGAQKRVAEATKAYQRAVDLAPALTDAQLNLAIALMEQGNHAAAAEACEAAIQASPDDANPRLKLAEIRTRQRRYDESLRLLEAAHRLAPYTHPPKVLQAVYLFQNGKVDRAQQLLGEAHAELPNHPVPSLFLGQMLRAGGQLELAREYLESAASLPVPANWPASHRKRFLILLHSERFQLAQQLEDEALARDALANWVNAEPENERLRALCERIKAENATPPVFQDE